jgi:hypothetical protein
MNYYIKLPTWLYVGSKSGSEHVSLTGAKGFYVSGYESGSGIWSSHCSWSGHRSWSVLGRIII